MIKASDVRRGNVVRFEGRIYRVFIILEDRVELMIEGEPIIYTSYQSVEPLELTPEVLEKAGAIKKEYLLRLDLGGVFLEYDTEENETTINAYLDYHSEEISIDIPKYVHQLQNLYYALRGKELEISL